ncbi:hypothetical protein MASR2M18_06040 [Ignavibacteria bacterium]|jgi:hypothetical protein|nr:hypothetical protein [Bacteroidota bacterium]
MINLRTLVFIFAVATMTAWLGCRNPFAPRLDDTVSADAALGDQRSVDGVFQNFRYAYRYKDTLTYGRLLAPDFIFIYRNYDRGIDLSWGRDEDMITTSGLFQAAQNIDLVWNDIAYSTGDSLTLDVSRGFTMTVAFDTADVLRVQGRANFRLARAAPSDAWMILRWRDESNY